jgi:uncharacterized membrane protein YphA (DoxX/SURF4 family)
LLIVAGFTAPLGLVALLLTTMVYGFVKHRARKHWLGEKFALVERGIQRTIADSPAGLTDDHARPA